MTFRLPGRALAATAAAALVLGACDFSEVPLDCALTPEDPACGAGSIAAALDAAYDTTGTTITVTDAGDGVAPGGVTWTADFTYVLANKAFVNDGQTLSIRAGTVVKGSPGLREQATALIVARGGRIEANGTAETPIIFTALADDVADPTDEPGAGSWGGLIVLGNASTNTTPGVLQIEGIPTNEPRGAYGCGDTFACDDNDDSGTLRYVSIRYGGAEIGDGNEINGLTLGGVGAGTDISYIEVFRNQDDGIEWFGGTANGRYLVSAFVGDEAFDTDQGYRGTNQFVLGIHDVAGDNGFEMDGGDSDLGGEDATPLSTPTFWNVTLIGADQNRAVRIRENSGPTFRRSIFTGFDRGVDIQDNASGADSRARLDDGTLILANNVFGRFVGSYGAGQDWTLAAIDAAPNGNRVTGDDSAVTSISTARTAALNPTSAGPALNDLGPAPTGGFLRDSDCIGAVCPGDDWLRGWTALSQLGYLAGAGV